MISLLTFIQTGHLGEIGLGSTRDEVELAFGPPQSWGWHSRGNWFSRPKLCMATVEKEGSVSPYAAAFWEYGAARFDFKKERVSLMAICFPTESHIGTSPLDCWGLSETSTYAEIKQRLSEEGIVHGKEEYDSPDDFHFFATESGVGFYFFSDSSSSLLDCLIV